MREVLALQIGQSGCNIGHTYWTQIAKEHGLDKQGHYIGSTGEEVFRINTCFHESYTGRFVPRAVFCDTELTALDAIARTEWGGLYWPDSWIFGQSGAGNNWAKGYYQEGARLTDAVLHFVRKQAESSEGSIRFQITHSLAGGTGGGLTSALTTRMQEEFPEALQTAYSVFPSKNSDVVVEPFNVVLTIHHLIDQVHQSICIENEKMYDLCAEQLNIEAPVFGDLNTLAAYLLSSITCTIRFGSQMNVDYRKLAVNLVAFPRLHFFSGSFAPLISGSSTDYTSMNERDLVWQIFDTKNMFCSITKSDFISSEVLFRGKSPSVKRIVDACGDIQRTYSGSFASWIPNCIKVGISPVPPIAFKNSATMLGNNMGIADLFENINSNFDMMLQRSAFVHWYIDNGLAEEQLTEAQNNMLELASEMNELRQGGDEN